MPTDPYAWIEPSLDTIHRANWYRSTKTIAHRPGAVIELDGQTVINFASNDYLGLAGDDRLIAAAIAATEQYGTGSTGSRLLSGHRAIHEELERAIAHLKQTEAAIVFSSGYLANLGTISALVSKRDLILSDRYNHSSLKNGALLSSATVLDYNHCDSSHLQELLTRHRPGHRRCLILTDTVFSMDGDLCPLPEILDLADEFDCMVLVDEAHATGVFGGTGAGCVEHFGCTGHPLIQMGTLSKAIGSLGGYVTGSAPLIDFLRNRATTWIYTTALSPADTAAALTALQIIQEEPDRRRQLWQNVHHLCRILPILLPAASPILRLPVNSPETALQLSKVLLDNGIFVSAVRPPTVPTSRLRLTLMATHQPAHLEHLATQLQQLLDTSPFASMEKPL